MKNCEECIHLEYVNAEDNYGNVFVFVCNKRIYKSYREENNHLEKLEIGDYRLKPKKCCERVKEQTNE